MEMALPLKFTLMFIYNKSLSIIGHYVDWVERGRLKYVGVGALSPDLMLLQRLSNRNREVINVGG
jgi:hypothetical protein